MKIQILPNRFFNGKLNRLDPFRAEIDGDCIAIGKTKAEAMEKAIDVLYGYYSQRCSTVYVATVPQDGCVIVGREYFPGNEDIMHFRPNEDGTMRSCGSTSGLIGSRSFRDSFQDHVKSYTMAVTPLAQDDAQDDSSYVVEQDDPMQQH